LLVMAGSVVGDDASAEPPVNGPVGVDEGTDSRTGTVTEAPDASGPAMVQLIGPAGIEPVQPEGNDTMSTPVGGPYVTVIEPAASAGPLLVTVMVAVPVEPGVIVGVDTVVTRSADGAPTVTLDGAALLAGSGSAVGDEAPAEPPVKGPAGVEAGTDRTTGMVAFAPDASGPAIVQVNGPAGIEPVQPDGNDTMSTPVGGL
jgi:hypothetical protein